ncbi:glycosyl transferase [bacterium]|nr:glycosyl transferase [bacterium]
MKKPSLQILSNGKLRSLVTAGGQGGLFYDWVAMTRFSETAPDACGPLLYLREGGRGSLARELPELAISQEVGIAPGVDVEIRKITLSNHAAVPREIELTTYAEIALNHPLGDAGHPAFSKLFVQTAMADESPTLLARRRPRGLNENWPWLAQTLITDGPPPTWESNRATFIGRGRTPRDPAAMDRAGALSCQTGNVLDPVMAWRCELTLAPRSTQTLWLLTAAAADEAGVRSLMRNVRAAGAAEILLTASKTAAAARLAGLGIDPAAAERYEAMAATMLFGRSERQVPGSLAGGEAVHRHPLAWDQIRVIANAGFSSSGTADVLAALPFWRALGLTVRVFVMDGEIPESLPEGVVGVDSATFTDDELEWWLASAQLVVGEGMFSETAGTIQASGVDQAPATDSRPAPTEALQCFNGHGGFSADGREYVIPMALENGRLHLPPMPWVNVLANPSFGCIVSERGAGYTWSRNSQANRLSPWSNDPIGDPHGEAFYLRDAETGALWSPLPGPCAPQSGFVVRHGFGRSRFISNACGLAQEVEFLVPPEDPIKLVAIRLKNESGAAKNLVFAAYHALILGSSPDRHHATLAWTDADGVQHAVNPRAGDFAGGRVFSFLTAHGVAALRQDSGNSSAAFLGAGGVEAPDSLMPGAGSARGFGRDACFFAKISFRLEPGAEVEILVGFSEVMSEEEELRLLAIYRQADAIRNTGTDAFWEKMLGGVKIRTPLAEVDLMVNGWLLYQNLACRIWGRSAFYQSGGAYGFRDQLQDSGALAALHPELMCAQILLHAAQQFPEGDVTHWWHPEPMGRGMRTKFADDLLWLPYLTDHYLQVTGDHGVLEESRAFIEGPLLAVGEDEEYMKPEISETTASVYEHCCLAIDKSLARGAHGLPLMGIGDWNDGMSRIGREGKGESVWMGFFLITILKRWIPRCEARGETARAEIYRSHREALLTAVNDAGWDGEWYRRAYYDDGTPLGTHSDDECRIDALAQAWAVISEAAPADRATKSLDSLVRELVDPEFDIIRLLHPPFVNTPHDPGYIKGYVAGVRENGGQYTHAACWVIRAMAEAGRRDQAAAMLQRLSPVWHSRDQAAVARYQVEPYVVAADIYGAAPHVGRGGWTWYTGSAGWMFRVAVESVLGLRVENGDTLVLDPRVPDGWPGYDIDFRTPSGRTLYRIEVRVPQGNADGVAGFTVDGVAGSTDNGIARWPMLDDGGGHVVAVVLGR